LIITGKVTSIIALTPGKAAVKVKRTDSRADDGKEITCIIESMREQLPPGINETVQVEIFADDELQGSILGRKL